MDQRHHAVLRKLRLAPVALAKARDVDSGTVLQVIDVLGKDDREVPLAHPRHYSVKTTPAFSALKSELTEAVRTEVLAAQERAAAAQSKPSTGGSVDLF